MNPRFLVIALLTFGGGYTVSRGIFMPGTIGAWWVMIGVVMLVAGFSIPIDESE
jgi:hypothetical protein